MSIQPGVGGKPSSGSRSSAKFNGPNEAKLKTPTAASAPRRRAEVLRIGGPKSSGRILSASLDSPSGGGLRVGPGRGDGQAPPANSSRVHRAYRWSDCDFRDPCRSRDRGGGGRIRTLGSGGSQ